MPNGRDGICCRRWQFSKPFRFFPVIRWHRRPRHTIGSLWLPIHVSIYRAWYSRWSRRFFELENVSATSTKSHGDRRRSVVSSTRVSVFCFKNHSSKAHRFEPLRHGTDRQTDRRIAAELVIAGIPRRRHRHRHPREDPRKDVDVSD